MIELSVVILAGGPRAHPIEESLGWPLAFLPLSGSCSLLEGWIEVIQSASSVVEGIRIKDLVVLVSSEIDRDLVVRRACAKVAREARAHRGTAGAVSDHIGTNCCDSRAMVLVVEMSASPAVCLEAMFRSALSQEFERRFCALGESALGRYAGVLLCDRDLFDLVPSVGFFDLKEQFLPLAIAAGVSIQTEEVCPRALRVRNRVEWLETSKAWTSMSAGNTRTSEGQFFSAGYVCGDSVLSRGAVTIGAKVVSSIVMDDAVVESGAIVARSVIGPGMRVPAGTRVIDAIVADPAAGEAVLRRLGMNGTASVPSE